MTRKATTAQPASGLGTLPVDVDLIRFEKNLLQIGFFGANETRGKGSTSRRVEQTVTRNGHKVKVAAEFRGSEALGLPSTTDRDKFIALLKIVSEDRATTGQINNPVRFSGYRMIQELGLARNGEIYEEILKWGKRMTDTTITSEQVVYFAAKKVYSDETLHVFRSFKRTGQSKLDGNERQEQYEVVLEDWVVENLNQRYVVPEDFSAYKQLTRPTAKGIFGNLHLWFHASQGRAIEKDYSELCNLLNVQAYPHLSKIRSTMGLALDELVKIKYVHAWNVERMSSKKGFKVVMTPGEQLLAILDGSRSDRRLASRVPEPLSDNVPALRVEQAVIRRLEDYGVLVDTAHSLVKKHGSARILAVAEYIDSQLTGTLGRKITNPAGLLIHSLENNLQIPTWFSSGKVQEAARSELSRKEALRLQAETEYVLWIESQREQYFSTQFTPDQLDLKLQQLLAEKSKSDPAFRRWSANARTAFGMQMIWGQAKKALDLPTIEEWVTLSPKFKTL